MIEISHLSHKFGEITALNNLNLKIEPGSLVAITGANGTGKSTLLKLIAGLYKPTQGNIICHSHRKAFLPQRSEMDRTFPLRVLDVAAMGLWSELGLSKRLSHKFHQRVMGALVQVGLESLSQRSILALSGGQLQRLLFARLILQDAPLILLDEPFAALDRTTTIELMHLLIKWHQEGRTILAVMHDLELVKKYFEQTMLLAHDLIAFGPTSKVLTAKNFAGALFHD